MHWLFHFIISLRCATFSLFLAIVGHFDIIFLFCYFFAFADAFAITIIDKYFLS